MVVYLLSYLLFPESWVTAFLVAYQAVSAAIVITVALVAVLDFVAFPKGSALLVRAAKMLKKPVYHWFLGPIYAPWLLTSLWNAAK